MENCQLEVSKVRPLVRPVRPSSLARPSSLEGRPSWQAVLLGGPSSLAGRPPLWQAVLLFGKPSSLAGRPS
jgi:hypothetical protein